MVIAAVVTTYPSQNNRLVRFVSKLLLLYNKTLSKHVTALFCLYLGNVETSANHLRNAPFFSKALNTRH